MHLRPALAKTVGMNLARFPRRRYTQGFTPIEPMRRLSSALDGPALYIKRDDLLGLAGGGNKTRKLEFLVAEALAEGADTLITCGAPQSNHCRLTLAAAAREGLRCRLIIEERVPGTFDPKALGNNLLFEIMGADVVRAVPLGTDLGAEMEKEAAAVAAAGGQAYVIPGGGSNPSARWAMPPVPPKSSPRALTWACHSIASWWRAAAPGRMPGSCRAWPPSTPGCR